MIPGQLTFELVWPGPPTDDWREDAACHGRPDVMFGNSEKAKAICATCPVRSQCRRFAADLEVEYGVFGGLDPAERMASCPVCGAVKPEPSYLACPEHREQRLSRLREQQKIGLPDVRVSLRMKNISQRTNPLCCTERGCSHTSARAYREGCRCAPARQALVEERRRRREAAREAA